MYKFISNLINENNVEYKIIYFRKLLISPYEIAFFSLFKIIFVFKYLQRKEI